MRTRTTPPKSPARAPASPRVAARVRMPGPSNRALGRLLREPTPEQARVAKLVADYDAAVLAADWPRAALLLNGFSETDIRARLARLPAADIALLKEGALASMPGFAERVRGYADEALAKKQTGPKTPFQAALDKNPAAARENHPIFGITGTLIGYFRSSSGYSEVRNTDGEIVWSHELPLEPGIPFLDPALNVVEVGLKQLGYAAIGTLDTVLENNWAALGIPSDEAHRQPLAQKLGIPLDATAYRIGRGAGNALALIQTAGEYIGGATLFMSGAGEFMAGVLTTPEGVGVVIVPVGVVSMAGGYTVMVHGGALGRATVMNMMKGTPGGGPAQPSIRPPKSVPRVTEKTARFKGQSPRDAFNKARADAIAKAKLGPDSVPFRQELGPEAGRITGRMNKDGVSGGWRLDFDPADPSKGLHINWWRMLGGKYLQGANIVEGGSQDLFWEILSHFPN